MKTRDTLLLTALAAFSSGFLAGMLFAPASAQDMRRRLTQSAQGSSRWVGDQLRGIEAQLSKLEQQIQTSGTQLGAKMKGAAKRATDPYLPSFPPGGGDWSMDRDEMAKDLRRLPRK